MALLTRLSCLCHILVIFFIALAEAANTEKDQPKASYASGDAIPVSCLNRTT